MSLECITSNNVIQSNEASLEVRFFIERMIGLVLLCLLSLAALSFVVDGENFMPLFRHSVGIVDVPWCRSC